MKTSIEQVIDEEAEKYRELLSSALKESLELAKNELKKAEKEEKRLLERAEEDGKRAYRHYTTQAELKSRGMILEIFEKTLDALVEEAVKELDKVGRTRLSKALKSFLLDAIDAIGSKEIEIRPSEKDAALIRKLCKEVEKEKGVKIDVSKGRLKSKHGFIAFSKDGKISVDYTPEALKERLKPLIRRMVAEEFLKEVM